MPLMCSVQEIGGPARMAARPRAVEAAHSAIGGPRVRRWQC